MRRLFVLAAFTIACAPAYADAHPSAYEVTVSVSDGGDHAVVVLHSDLVGLRVLDFVLPPAPELVAGPFVALPSDVIHLVHLQPGRDNVELDVGVRRWRGVRS